MEDHDGEHPQRWSHVLFISDGSHCEYVAWQTHLEDVNIH
jgi:hypothetical protein